MGLGDWGGGLRDSRLLFFFATGFRTMNLNQLPQLPGPRRPNDMDEFIERLLTGLGLVHALFKWILGSLGLLILIVIFSVTFYLAWRGGGQVVEWADVFFSKQPID